MAIITTYVCDVSGKQGEAKDFVKITVLSNKFSHQSDFLVVGNIEKCVHRDVALKLNLIHPKKDEPAQPEPTLESKLMTLLKDYIQEIAYEAGDEAACNAISNRG